MEVCLWHLKSSVRTVVDLMCIKPGFMPASELLTPIIVQNTKKLISLPFQKDCRNCLIGLLNIPVLMFVWNHQVNTGIPVFNVLEKTCWITLAHPKYTKPQKGNKTDRKDAKWICDLFMCDMIKPSFIPPPDIRHLRDLLRFRMKVTYQITGMKNRALNCLTVSNLKLDDVFSDVFGKSSSSIIQQILEHPGESFDVTPYIHKLCKHPIEEIQAAIDGEICPEQATKLKLCLDFIDEQENIYPNLIKKFFVLLNRTPLFWNLCVRFRFFLKNP